MLATNECNKALTMKNMFALYKPQESVEKGFNFKKIRTPSADFRYLKYKTKTDSPLGVFGFQGLLALSITQEESLVVNLKERNRVLINYMEPIYKKSTSGN